MMTEAPESMVQSLALLLRDHVDTVLDGSHILTLSTPCLQVLTRLFEQLFPRGPRIGFQALPSYPADSVPILHTQFLFDVLQKTPSLKLFHPAECPSQFYLTIFPLKSLKYLELRCIPPHCLCGLRHVSSQLEVLIWSRCVSSVEEVLFVCGGDLRESLPWVLLHTLDFSYNMIHSLDQSLRLLNSLRTLDLSHNRINDCGSYLKVLTELQYLNLGYNFLESIPVLSASSAVHLHTLILRHNQLSSTSGLEYLRSLQNLNLSYNLLVKPSQLSGLAKLKKLRKLFLEGNPLYFHKDYKVFVVQHLSRKAVDKVLLDGKPLCGLQTMGSSLSRVTVTSQPRNSATESSCTGDMTDSCSEKASTTSIPRKKTKVKVRSVSISEQSDSECEQRRPPTEKVLDHQEDIERTDNFRDLYGEDWLLYRSHLEEELSGDPTNTTDPTKPSLLDTKASYVPPILQTSTIADTRSRVPEIRDPRMVETPSPDEDELTASDVLIEQIENALEDELWRRKDQEEEDVIKDKPVSSPVTACPLVNGRPRDSTWPWVFLQVTELHLLEIELKHGQVMRRIDLRRLQDIKTESTKWTWDGEEKDLPLLTLSFYSICKDEQSVSYVVVDNSKDISVENLLEALRPVLELNLKVPETDGPVKLKCLKCRSEFIRKLDRGQNAKRLTEDGLPDDSHPDLPNCPRCRSSHVILIPMDHSESSSVSLPSGQSPEGAVGGRDREDGSRSSSSCMRAKDDRDSNTSGKITPIGNLWSSYDYGSTTPSPTPRNIPPEECWQISPTSMGTQETLDFRVINHRLKLYLDLEILNGEMEEFQCAMKVPVVRFGKPEEVWNLVVVSSQKIYFLEITGESRGSPDEWLQARDSYALTSLTHLHLGLQEQCLYLGFDSSEAAYTLLTRNRKSSTNFSQHIIDTMSALPSRYLRDLNYSPKEEVTPDHRLWNLLHNSLGEEDHIPDFLYVLAHFKPEGSLPGAAAVPCVNADQQLHSKPSNAALDQGATGATAVSLLLTKNHMCLLEEDHQWLHVAPPAGEGDAQELPKKMTIKEIWAIYVMYSVHLFNCAPLHLRIRLYHEEVIKETAWLLWTEDPSLPKEIAEWFRGPWEALFQISLQLKTHDKMKSYVPCDS